MTNPDDMPDHGQLKEALSFASAKDYATALAICTQFIESNPELADGFRTRSQVYCLMKDFAAAIDDRSVAIQRDPARPPGDFFFRGWWRLERGEFSGAIADQTMCINLGSELDFHYFDESAFFFRAVALLRLKRFEEALADCERVRDDFLIYLQSGKVSRVDIVQEAKSRIGPKRT